MNRNSRKFLIVSWILVLVAAELRDIHPLRSVDGASLLQLSRKDSLRPAENSLLESIIPIEQNISMHDPTSRSLMMTRAAAAVHTWCLLLGEAPKHLDPPKLGVERQPWLGIDSQRRITTCCTIICCVFMSMWAWRQSTPRTSKQTYCCSHASQDELLRMFASLPMNWRHVCIYMCAMMGHAGCGAINDTIGLAFGSFEEEWGLQTPSRLACLSLASTAGQILSGIFAGACADSKGRCLVARYASVLVVFSSACIATAPSLEMLAAARFFAGLGFGALLVTVPTLLSECLPKHARCLLVLYQLGWPLGAAAFTFMMSVGGWRAANFAIVPFTSFILVMFWSECIPESPTWLCSRGRFEEAVESVYQHGGSLPPQEGADIAPPIMVEDGEGGQQVAEIDGAASMHYRYALMALGMFCTSVASMLIKVWLPSLLTIRNVPTENNAFVGMWILEASAIFITGAFFGSPSHGTRNDNLALLRVAQGSFIIAGLSVLGYIKITSALLITILGGIHLVGQANASNFLLAFATLSFPVAVRARCVGIIYLAQYVGCFLGPLLGSLFLQFASGLGAGGVLMVGSLIYFSGYLSTVPLSNHSSAK